MRYAAAMVTLTVVLMAGNLWAGDFRGEISQQTLAEMGLTSLQPVNDAEGDMVRGEGFLDFLGLAFGRSTSNSTSLASNASASAFGLGNNVGAASTETRATDRIGIGLFPLSLFFTTSAQGHAIGLAD